MIKKQTQDKIILGIDPGTNIMGFSVIQTNKSQITLLQYGIILLSKYKDHYIKLKHIYEKTSNLIEEFTPDELSIESPFFGKNVQSMLKLGRAQGVCIAAAIEKQIPVFEYAPKKIKQSVTGNGNASKEQVAKALEYTLKQTINIQQLDSTDAIAVAICHYYSNNLTGSSSKSSSWSSFIDKNKERVKK